MSLGLLGSVSRAGDLLFLWETSGYYLGGIVTEGRFWVGESRVWGDLLRLGLFWGEKVVDIGCFSGSGLHSLAVVGYGKIRGL